MYINSILPIHPCPHPALCPHVCTLHLCLYSSSADRLICTIFLDSTYIYYHLFLGFPHSSLVKNLPAMQFDSWVGKICWKRDRLPTPVFLDFPCGSAGKESACKARDLVLIPGLGRSPGKGKGYPLQYSGLENSMDCMVYRVANSWTQLSDFHFHSFVRYRCSYFHFTGEDNEAQRSRHAFQVASLIARP